MELGLIRQVDIDREMQAAYLDYAMSVIVARALPDARDGLKPVHRRILYAMYDMGLRPDAPYKKSARIVGEVLGKYHPHGDAAVYDSMVRMAQDFSMRYVLVDGQGNFGSVDGDAPAAMRYTEARLAAPALELLQDIDKETVNCVDNFDGTLKEPEVLPARLPNLLLNGSSGIAVGMATNIPPHNLGELADAISYLIDHWEQQDEVTVEDLMRFVKGPDFPTGGLIVGGEGIQHAYATGRGRLVVRAVAHIEEMRGGRHRIVITELPYQVNKTSLIERIAELAREGRLTDLSEVRDESDRRGMSLIIELKRGAQPRAVLNQLFKYTPLQTTFGVQMLALVDGEPRMLSLKKALQVYIEHRREVIARRSRFELERARQRAHILEGLKKALDVIDQIIKLIRAAKTTDEAKQGLVGQLKFSELQAQAILDMQLRRLAALERQKIEEEYTEVTQRIAYLQDLLTHPRKILGLIKDDMRQLKEKYGDERRTRIVPEAEEEFREEDLVPDEEVLISITQRGYVKRVPARVYKSQARGGRGITGMTTREEDAVLYLLAAGSLDSILFFSDRGRVYMERAYQIPDADRQAKGLPITNLLALAPGERVTAVVARPQNGLAARYLTMVTRLGRVKRMALSEIESARRAGIVAISLEADDELGWVRLTRGDQDLILVTERGKALRFNEATVRPMGRAAAGVNAIRLEPGDAVASMDVVEPGAELLVVTTRGYGKRVPLSDYPTQGRAGGGVVTLAKSLDVTGVVAAARVVRPDDEVTIISAQGLVLRTAVKNVPQMSRSARGARIMDLKDGDSVASLARLDARQSRPPSGDGHDGDKTG
ncbi:MAG: DNA gyrase subunit A [Chloroflexota bacterium]